MSQLFDTAFTCGDGEALVTYVYGESSPAEHEAITAHLARCVACAEEAADLGLTRVQLAGWAPPRHVGGFQITQADAIANRLQDVPQSAAILRPAAWWQRPLPGWAQIAAAVLIFASGMMMGMARNAASPAPATVATDSVAALPVAKPAAAPIAVTREELAQVEQRLRGEMVRTASKPAAPAAGDDRVVMQRVAQLIAASEARQQRELEFRTSVLATDFANARLRDLTTIERRLGSTSVKVLSNQQDINSLAQRVGYSPASSPYVP